MEYNFELRHITGKKNGRADALSRRPDYDTGDNDNKKLVVIPDKYFGKVKARVAGSEWANLANPEEWKRFLSSKEDPEETLHEQVQKNQHTGESKARLKKWKNTYPLLHKGNWWMGWRTIIAGDNDLKRGVVSYFHDKPSAGHPGISNTYHLIKLQFWWPNMKQDVEQYVKGCAACQDRKSVV